MGLKNLKVLKAHHNKFSVLPNEIAAFQLQELDLHGNQLVTLAPWLLVKLSKYVFVYVYMSVNCM